MWSFAVQGILVVDDDPILRELVLEELTSQEYNCFGAGSAGEAWKVLEKEEITCVITDLVMQDSSGVDLIERIKSDQRFSKMPIIIASGVLDLASQSEEDLGVEKVLIKPFLLVDLVSAIEKIEFK